MLKSVKFNGFEELPEVRKRIETTMMPLVEDELQHRANHISLTWSPQRNTGLIQLEVRDDVFGANNGVIPDAANERSLRWAVRDLHWTLARNFTQRSVDELERNSNLDEGK